MTRVMFAAVLAAACGGVLQAQWLNYHDRGIPRTRDGKPDLSAPAPRGPDRKPDLSGVWATDGTPPEENKRLIPGIADFVVPGDDPSRFSKYFFNFFADLNRQEEDLLTPAAAALFRSRLDATEDLSPSSRCLPSALPMAALLPLPYKIVQTSRETLILYEVDNLFRQIYTDGRTHTADASPTWLGYSIGRWEGETFVAETAGFNDLAWLDGAGHPRSEKLKLTERFTRRDFGHMNIAFTVEDPAMYTRPVTIRVSATLQPDTDVQEYICLENQKLRASVNGR